MSTQAGNALAIGRNKTTKKFDVAALGSGNIDIFLSIPSLPTRGGKVVGTRLGEQAGGTVANSACDGTTGSQCGICFMCGQ